MAFDPSRVQAILFDVDGTLRDTDDQWVAWLEGLLRRAKFLYPRRDLPRLARRIVMGIEEPGNWMLYLADRLGFDNLLARSVAHWRPQVEKMGEAVVGPPAPWVIPGIVEMLQRLAPHYPLAVVSARPRRSTMHFLDGHHLSPMFKAIATGQTTYYTKPFPDPLLWAAEQLGVAPESCVMVGDTTVDMRAGRAAGMQTLGVLCGFGDSDELTRSGADLILATTAQVADILIPQVD